MKFYKFTACALALILSTTSLAAKKNADDYRDTDDYDSSAYYENEGTILFKVRGSFISSHAKQKKMSGTLSNRGKISPQANKSFVSNGYGLEGAALIFLGDNIAAELSGGLSLYKPSKTAVTATGYNYSDVSGPAGKRKNIYAIPVNLTLQWHFAPFGAIRPYVGGGYNGTYFIAKAKEYKISAATGPVIQCGVDFVMTDDTILNIDVKKMFISPAVTFKDAYLGKDTQGNQNSAKGKLPLNPWYVSVGLGWKF